MTAVFPLHYMQHWKSWEDGSLTGSSATAKPDATLSSLESSSARASRERETGTRERAKVNVSPKEGKESETWKSRSEARTSHACEEKCDATKGASGLSVSVSRSTTRAGDGCSKDEKGRQ